MIDDTKEKQPKYKWSYSSLSLFQQCPRKFYRLKVAKDVVEPEGQHLIYGKELHKAAEEYVRDGTPIPPQFAFVKNYLDIFKALSGDQLCEHQMGLTKSIEPCGFFDEDVWWRGVADLLIVDGESAILVDYKTGKSARYADTKQLEILSLAVFKHFPEVQHIKAGLLFVVSKEFIQCEFFRDGQKEMWTNWFGDLQRLERAYEHSVWNPQPNFTCRNHCPVKDCEYHGKN